MSLAICSTELAMYRAQAAVGTHGVLQFKRDSDSMELWGWPTTVRHRVHPGNFRHYRDIKCMLGPCCLCPKIDTSGPDYVEAAIYRVKTGPFAGQYVIGCARAKCGYIVFAEHLYTKPGVFVKMYESRAHGEHAPPAPRHDSEELLIVNGRLSTEEIPNHLWPAALPSIEDRPLRPLKRSYAMLDINVASVVPKVAPPVRTTPSPIRAPIRLAGRRVTSNLLELLDSRVRPGITENEFKHLFVQCSCGNFFTKRACREHACLKEVIDLTGDDVTVDEN